MGIVPALQALPLFTFSVDNLEGNDRTGNWVYDADGASMPSHDANPLTFGASSPHFYAEKVVENGTLICTAENVALAANPAEITIHFNTFELVSFTRINTTDPALPWNVLGQAGDRRVYSNANGYIALNGVPKLYMKNATFVITTPYPTQAQIRTWATWFPPLGAWVGSIGSGAPQTGYGFGDVDQDISDPAWAALFAASNFKIDLAMVGITSVVLPTQGLFDFDLEISPAVIQQETDNDETNTGSLGFPAQNVVVEVTSSVPGGAAGDMNSVYINEIQQTPTGALPVGLSFATTKYWLLGSTYDSFNLRITFSLSSADFAKGPGDWRILFRPYHTAPWIVWTDYTLLDSAHIRANNITQQGEFAIASPLDETLPVEMSSFTAYVNSDNLASLKWVTASETAMQGFLVYANTAASLNTALQLTPNVIPAQNSSSGASYSFTAVDITAAGTYYFWLEARSLDGSSQYYGPNIVKLSDPEDTPALPIRTSLQAAYPNPFVSKATIRAEIKNGEQARLGIYNVAGQLIKSFDLIQGSHELDWDGKDASGMQCASGVYIYRLTSPTASESRKMILMKN
jgi:hypothetical protein